MTTIGSLFSGIGGLEMGLERCGLGPVRWQCDSDPAARAVLEAHWPGAKRFDDVRRIGERSERVDVICGGFPCQPVSILGQRKVQRDARWLWPFFAAVVSLLRPRVVFIENVAALRQAGLRDVLADLASLGFDAEWDMFSACETGAPHVRRRMFVMAYANGKLGKARIRALLAACGRPALQTENTGEMPRDLWLASDGDVCRMADGTSTEMDRLRLIGNACVPAQAALAWRTLAERCAA